MPKYRLLSLEELNALEKEFIDYLVVNTITADEWEKIKIDNPKKADSIIELFSDVVFESILRKVQYLEYRSKDTLKTFQCLKDSLVVVVMESKNSEETVDFTNPQYIEKASSNPPATLKFYTASKPYKQSRESELFEMLQTGCTITDDKLFKTLCLMLPSV